MHYMLLYNQKLNYKLRKEKKYEIQNNPERSYDRIQ